MKEVLDDLIAAYKLGDTTAMATVVRTWRSAPRPAGASMLVNAAGEAVGSVSGGCIEGAVYEMAGEVIANGVPQFEKYGISN
ncbi:MAG: XdhC family protein, partial [Actinobacteria bacterium]|nr:XdhC family protein [Actinomycetota bacterium]